MTPMKRTPIAERKKLNLCYLQDEYAAGQSQISPIHAYNAVDARRKKQFLDDARLYLRSVGEHLRVLAGFAEQSIHVNPAGIAASGEVSGEFFHPDRDRHIWLEIGTEQVVGLSPREDQVSFLARWEQDRPGQGSRSGPNCWLNSTFSSSSTARCLLTILADEHLMAQHWWWQENGEILAGMQWHEYDQIWQWPRQQAVIRRRQAWQPTGIADPSAASLWAERRSCLTWILNGLRGAIWRPSVGV